MPINRQRKTFAYGVGDDLIQLPPLNIISDRAPTVNDLAEIGTFWIDEDSDSVYTCTGVAAGTATWVTSPASGVGTFTAVTVNPSDLTMTAGDIIVSLGDVEITAGNLTIGGDVTVTGDMAVSGDFDITSADSVGFSSTKNAAEAIYFKANGGTSETILISSAQGTLATSINVVSTAGGITLTATGNATTDAINLNAPSGGVDIDGALEVSISSSEDAASAISLNASAGGIDILATGEAAQDINITNSGGSVNITATEDDPGAIYIHANGGSTEIIQIHADQGTGADSVELLSDVGGITLTAGVASDDAINLAAGAGGVDIDGALQVNIASSEAAADAIVINASAGGIDISADGAGLDVDIASTAGSITVTGSEAAATAVVIEADDAAGGVQVKAGTGGILIGNEADTTTIDVGDAAPGASRTITVAGGTVIVAAVTDLVDIAPDGATTNADSVKQVDIATGAVTTGQSLVNINSGTAASGTHTTSISTGTGGGTKVVNVGNADGLTTVNIDAITLINDSVDVATSINTGTSTGTVSIGNALAGAITVDTAAGISLDSATASNFTVTGAVDLTLDSSAGSVNIAGGEDAPDAVVISAGAGGIDILATGEAGQDIDITNTGGSVNITATEDDPGAIYIHANGGVTEIIQIHADQGTGADSVELLSDVGGITLTAGVASDDAINLAAGAGGVDIDGALQVNIASSEAAADAIVINASAGGIDISADGAGLDVDIASTAGSITVTGSEAAATAIVIEADDAAGGVQIKAGTGGIDLDAAGIATVTPDTATFAGAAVTIDANVGVGTFTGLTTAAAASQTFTITNSVVSATSAILATVSNLGSNDAQMTLTRVKQGAGSFEVMTTNNGAAALNGNVVITFWVIQ